jgi:hypothetical protein
MSSPPVFRDAVTDLRTHVVLPYHSGDYHRTLKSGQKESLTQKIYSTEGNEKSIQVISCNHSNVDVFQFW